LQEGWGENGGKPERPWPVRLFSQRFLRYFSSFGKVTKRKAGEVSLSMNDFATNRWPSFYFEALS
jgi:hypothetical protein